MTAKEVASALTPERIASALIILLSMGVGGGAYVSKDTGPSASDLVNALEKKDVQTHHEMEMKNSNVHQESLFDRADTKRRVTDLERYQIESSEQFKEVQTAIRVQQLQIENVIDEVKEMKE